MSTTLTQEERAQHPGEPYFSPQNSKYDKNIKYKILILSITIEKAFEEFPKFKVF